MPATDREERLRRADRARQLGRFDVAVAEVEALMVAFPDDQSLANMLGDLHVSQGQPAQALPLYLRVGDHYFHEGFYSKAVGVYRKILKFVPRDESMVLRLAEALLAQGLVVEARAHFGVVEAARRQRGDVPGAEDVALRMADLDPADLEGRWTAARALAQRGDASAGQRYEDLATEFERQQRFDEALAVWHEAVALAPDDVSRRTRAARRSWDRGDVASARMFLRMGDVSQHGPALALLVEVELRAGTPDGVRAATSAWLDFDRSAHVDMLRLVACSGVDVPERPWACVTVLVDKGLAAGRPAEAEQALRAFVSTGVAHGPALVKWIEVAVLAHLDGVADVVRERLAMLPQAADAPVTARTVVEAASRRVSPHGVWTDLFDNWLGRSDRRTEVTAPDSAPAPPSPPVATPVQRSPAPDPREPEFIEVDLTAALNALSVSDVKVVVPASQPAPIPVASRPTSARAHEATAAEAVDAMEALTLGQTYLAAGLIDRAREVLLEALGAPPTAVRAALALADLYVDADLALEACRVLDRVLPSTAGRERGQVLAQLVTCLDRAGDAARARQRLRELADVVPDHPVLRTWGERRRAPGR